MNKCTHFYTDGTMKGFEKINSGIVYYYTVFQKKTSTHIIGYKLRNSLVVRF